MNKGLWILLCVEKQTQFFVQIFNGILVPISKKSKFGSKMVGLIDISTSANE